MAESFFVDGMTVSQILNLSTKELNKLNSREMSRALRTVSLAANKRLNRLKENAVKTPEGYKAKSSAKHQISTDALNWVTNDGHKRVKFGVGQTKTRNEMLKQFSTIKQFMGMKSSTITGSVNLRRSREKNIFGMTREQAAKGTKSKSGKAKLNKMFEDKYRDVWEAYHKYCELKGRDPHAYWSDSSGVLEEIGSSILSGEKPEEATFKAISSLTEQYENKQAEYRDLFNDDDFLSWER